MDKTLSVFFSSGPPIMDIFGLNREGERELSYKHSIQHESPEMVWSLNVKILSQFNIGIVFKDLKLVYSKSFEMNQPCTLICHNSLLAGGRERVMLCESCTLPSPRTPPHVPTGYDLFRLKDAGKPAAEPACWLPSTRVSPRHALSTPLRFGWGVHWIPYEEEPGLHLLAKYATLYVKAKLPPITYEYDINLHWDFPASVSSNLCHVSPNHVID